MIDILSVLLIKMTEDDVVICKWYYTFNHIWAWWYLQLCEEKSWFTVCV